MKLVNIKQEGKDIANRAMQKFNVEILWHLTHEVKQNRRVPVECNTCGFCCVRSVNDLKLGKYLCYGCFVKTRTEYVESYNFSLQYISQNKLFCKCNGCGVNKSYSLGASYNSGLVCGQCVENKIHSICSNKNFTYNGRSSESRDKLHVTCNQCLNLRVLHYSSVAASEFSCPTCYENSKNSDMNPLGFNVISYLPQGRILLSCKECGYWKSSVYYTIKKERLKCINCTKLKYEESLLNKNCKFISKDGRLIKFTDPEGKTRVSHQSSVLSGKFAVNDENHWLNSTALYCIVVQHNGSSFCKIGTASNVPNRYKELKITAESYFEELIRFEDRWEADRLEKYLHKTLNNYRISPELAREFSGRKIKGGKVDGITEWFEIDVLHHVKEIVNGINRHSETPT